MIGRSEVDDVATIIHIDVMLAKQKMGVTELSERAGLTMVNLTIVKNGGAKAVVFSTLEARLWITSKLIF